MADNGVFISYRRGTGSAEARVIQAYLESEGFDVFLDVDRLGSGHFDEQLLRQIESRRNFLLVCSPGSLDRCANEGDWVRREIAHALKTERHIVPVTLPGFVWPSGDGGPAEVVALQRHNAFGYSHEHWSSIRRKLALMLKSSAQRRPTGAAGSQESPRPARNRGLWMSLAVSTVMVASAVGWMFLVQNGVFGTETLNESGSDSSISGAAGGMGSGAQAPASSQAAGSAPVPSSSSAPAAVDRAQGGPVENPSSSVAHAEPERSSPPQAGLSWAWDAEVLAAAPDPNVVTDADGRARMVETGLPWKVRDRKTGIVMLLCPPGEFVMGSPASEFGRSEDETQHRRIIRNAFYLSETEVTQEQWQKAMGSNPSHFQGDRNPVESVSWSYCRQFLAASGMRFPTEAEWEYACRAGTLGAYAGDLEAMGWFEGTSGRSTHPVATKLPNPWGFFDMHGNVWEWMEDVYSLYPMTVGSDQQAVSTGRGSARVLRGGSFKEPERYQRSSYRDKYGTVFRSWNYGLRAARNP